MRRLIWAGLAALSLGMGGCGTVGPMSFEEALNTPAATRGLPGSAEEELRYRVGFQYANRARLADDSSWAVRNPDTLNGTTYNVLTTGSAIANFSSGQTGAGALDIVTWLNDGLGKDARYAFYVKYTMPYVGLPNTQYYRFDETPGRATAADVNEAWEAAYRLMGAMFPANECKVFGWTPELEYAKTHMKNASGVYKEILYVCPHPVFPGETIKVNVAAYANPAKGLRTVAMVQSNCWIDRERDDWLDITPCGVELANKQISKIPAEPLSDWMQLFTTPSAEDVGKMVTVARYRSRELMMAPPVPNPEYGNWLRQERAAATSEGNGLAGN